MARIRDLCRNQNITMSELANRLDCSLKTVTNWDTGGYYSPIKACEKLALELGVPIRLLFEKQNRINLPRKW